MYIQLLRINIWACGSKSCTTSDAQYLSQPDMQNTSFEGVEKSLDLGLTAIIHEYCKLDAAEV